MTSINSYEILEAEKMFYQNFLVTFTLALKIRRKLLRNKINRNTYHCIVYMRTK
jgi:hypothetical protein